jgi:hypothetical protein
MDLSGFEFEYGGVGDIGDYEDSGGYGDDDAPSTPTAKAPAPLPQSVPSAGKDRIKRLFEEQSERETRRLRRAAALAGGSMPQPPRPVSQMLGSVTHLLSGSVASRPGKRRATVASAASMGDAVRRVLADVRECHAASTPHMGAVVPAAPVARARVAARRAVADGAAMSSGGASSGGGPSAPPRAPGRRQQPTRGASGGEAARVARGGARSASKRSAADAAPAATPTVRDVMLAVRAVHQRARPHLSPTSKVK